MSVATNSAKAFFPDRGATLSRRDATNSLVFAHVAFILAICLQRIGFMSASGSYFFFSVIGFYALIGWGMLVGLVRIRSTPALLYGPVIIWFLFSAAISSELPYRGIATSPSALLLALVSNAIFIFGPSKRFDSSVVFDAFLFYVRLCAVLAVVQMALQLGGIRIFSFGDAFPALDPILIEKAYNQNAVDAYGSLNRRANGFFPLEPSTLSQLLAIATVIDVFLLRRFRYVGLYAFAYVMSLSGSGLLVVLVTFLLYPIIAPLKSLRVVALGSVLAIGIGLVFIAYPEPFDPIVKRATEFNSTQSSAYARYLAQMDTWEFLFRSDRVLLGAGPGSLERSPAFFPGSQNAALKVAHDYGLVGCFFFFMYLILSIFSRQNELLSLVMLVNYQLGAGNFVTFPILIMTAMLCIWAVPVDIKRQRAPRFTHHE